MNNHRYSSFFNNHNGIVLLMVWMTIIPWISTLTISYFSLEYESWIRSFEPAVWVFFFLASIITMGLAITPTTFISLVCGYFLGIGAVLPVIICYQFASLIGFALARKMDDHTIDSVKEKFPKSAPIFNNVESNQWTTTFLARISPALPFGLMNVVLSISGVRIVPFFFGGLFGMLPRTIFFVWLGAQATMLIAALQSNDHLLWFFLLSAAGIFGLYKMLKPRP